MFDRQSSINSSCLHRNIAARSGHCFHGIVGINGRRVLSREDYIAIAARLFAIYVFVKTALQIPAAVQALSEGGQVAWAGLYALVLLTCLAICVWLWFFPLTIARKLLPVMKEPRSEQAISAPIALSIGLTLIGVWFLAEGAIDAIYWFALIMRTKQMPHMSGFEWSSDQIASMVATAFELVVGIWLVLGNAGFRRVIYKFRYGEQ